ncbi:BatD family protein [Kangiella geojedonensis]|uniref:DUF7939 domain-containing protein n=1 Tax=Kangiella geojedonensis TaxID=914150 RepID=A0A0F6TQ58_9GAMM|nr:BatD family protein [Kangiella geojedonensis]AKE51534.1 hypothetical protein TQ33_0553 [Kangiella geojedonensis]
MKYKQSIIQLISMLLLTLAASTASAKITLALDRTDIHANETFHLRVQVEESSTLSAGASKNFIPEAITIRSRQEFNSSVIINGQYNAQMGWDFELLAKEPGIYTIPALSIGNEHSEPFTIRIMPQQDDIGDAANAKIKLRAKLSDEEVYVQQQLMFTLRIYRSVVARNQKITPIRVSNALVEQLGDNKTFDVVQNGNNFRVVEQRYAIFPQQSGEMVIEPITYSATVLEDSSGRSPWQRSQLKPISLSTQKYTIKVKPKPQNADEPWLPASNLELEAEWQPKNQTFRVGDPANLDFIIKGTGLLKTQLPTVSFPDQEGITIYRDTPQYHQRINRFGVNSYHFEKIAIIPNQAGELTIPEVRVPWWNVKTDQQEYAVLPAQTIKVEQSSQQIADNKAQTVIPEAQQKAMQQKDTATPTVSSNDTGTSSRSATYWQYTSYGLFLLWLLTLLLLIKRRNKTPAKNVGSDEPNQQFNHNSKLKDAISAAKSNNAKATAQHLTSWLKNQANPASVNNITQLIQYCHSEHQPELAEELANLQQACYSKSANQSHSQHSWQGQRLAQYLSTFKWTSQNQSANSLPGLYDKRL